MANDLVIGTRVLGGGKLTDLATGAAQLLNFGGAGGVMPSLNLGLAYGTGDGQANQWYLAQRPLAATTYDLLDLAGGLTNALGQTVAFTKLKYALVAVVSPDGTKKVRVGPQNQTNAAALGWGSAAVAAVYTDVYEAVELRNTVAGWTITGGSADVFPVYNPTGSGLTYALLLVGVA